MKKVLVIIDAQNDFITGSLANHYADACVPGICEFIKKFADDDSHIVLTRDTHYNNYLETAEGIKLPVKHCIYETAGWCVDDRIIKTLVDLNKQYTYIDKPTFGYLGWDYYWNDCEITICGFVSDICVASNALILRAKYPNANIKVMSKLCAGLTPENHEAAMTVLKSCQIEVVE